MERALPEKMVEKKIWKYSCSRKKSKHHVYTPQNWTKKRINRPRKGLDEMAVSK